MTNGIFYFASVHYLYSKFRVACDVTFLNIAKYFNIRKIKFGIFFIFKKRENVTSTCARGISFSFVSRKMSACKTTIAFLKQPKESLEENVRSLHVLLLY